MPAKTGIVDIKNIDIFERFNHPILILQKNIMDWLSTTELNGVVVNYFPLPIIFDWQLAIKIKDE